MVWVKAAELADMEEGQGVRICHLGRVVAVFLAEGELYAVDDRCTHAEASLSEGEVFDTEVECPPARRRFRSGYRRGADLSCYPTRRNLPHSGGRGKSFSPSTR